MSSANGGDWSPYDPLDATHGPARAGDHGACGDPAGGEGAHEVGGRFYHGGVPVATYTAGGTVDFELAITAHHNGFMEWWVCDADKCGGGDPTGACFATPGACVRLDRVAHPACEAGTEADCGPIQPEYPSRWYLPCKGTAAPPMAGRPLVFGGPAGKMRYALPAGFSCSRCVAQWYWATANSCTPPGAGDYAFPGAWTNCPAGMPTCGAGAPWPEEFWTCSDVTIEAAGGGGGGGAPPPTPQPVPLMPPRVTPPPAQPRQVPPSAPPAQPTWAPPPAMQPLPPPPMPMPSPPAPRGSRCMALGSWCMLEGVPAGDCCAGTSCSPYEGSSRFSMCL